MGDIKSILQKKKPVSLIAFLSLVLPGLGQAYLGNEFLKDTVQENKNAYKIIAAGIVMYFISLRVPIFYIATLFLIAWNVVDAYNKVRAHNKLIDLKLQKQGSKSTASEETLDSALTDDYEEYINANYFIGEIKKIRQLKNAAIIDEEEYRLKKNRLINNLAAYPLEESPTDFLIAMIPARKNNLIDEEDLKAIKKVLLKDNNRLN